MNFGSDMHCNPAPPAFVSLEFTRLETAMSVEFRGNSSRISLPAGNNVCLDCLQLQHRMSGTFQFEALLNLDSASRLTFLEFKNCCADNLVRQHWPHSLPALRRLELSDCPGHLPCQMMNYCSLRVVKFGQRESGAAGYNESLPPWFSQMTQLEEVAFHGCQFPEVPPCVLQLSRLKALLLTEPAAPMELPAQTASLAAWPNLTCLNLRGLD